MKIISKIINKEIKLERKTLKEEILMVYYGIFVVVINNDYIFLK